MSDYSINTKDGVHTVHGNYNLMSKLAFAIEGSYDSGEGVCIIDDPSIEAGDVEFVITTLKSAGELLLTSPSK